MRVLLLTGTCGSGKSTVAARLASRPGWTRLSEDEIWLELYGLNRGPFGSDEHRAKRHRVQSRAFTFLEQHSANAISVAVDVTLHEAPPEGLEAYRVFLEDQKIRWAIRVLHPALEVAISRDAGRGRRPMTPERIAQLHAKFTGKVFPSEWFIDTSNDTVDETVARLVNQDVA